MTTSVPHASRVRCLGSPVSRLFRSELSLSLADSGSSAAVHSRASHDLNCSVQKTRTVGALSGAKSPPPYIYINSITQQLRGIVGVVLPENFGQEEQRETRVDHLRDNSPRQISLRFRSSTSYE